MVQYPGTLVIPSVIFTDKKDWRVDVDRKIDMCYNQIQLIHFELILECNSYDQVQSWLDMHKKEKNTTREKHERK